MKEKEEFSLGSNQSVLVYDVECDSLDVDEAKVKFFGCYSFLTGEYQTFRADEGKDIKNLLENHKVLVGFNNRDFDNPILENNYGVNFDYKVIVDLFHVSKLRLPNMGIRTPTLKLKDIVEKLELDQGGKGEIDYKIFEKDSWTTEELVEIEKYLKQDVMITTKLMVWFFNQFKPLRKYLSEKDRNNYADVKASTASLGYRVICNMAGKPASFSNDSKRSKHKIFGGHHIEPRKDRAKGNIVSVDFVSAYPHAIIQGNLLSESSEGWDGAGYYNIDKVYNDKELGKVEDSLRRIFLERIKAKKDGDKTKNTAYKIVINSFYGALGNSVFKDIYNPYSAANCTSIVRTWMKKLAKTLEENGFFVLYGFTDSVMVEVPPELTTDDLMYVVNKYIEEVKKYLPFPQETFKLEIDKEMKFIWFVAKNCYLWVDKNDKVGYRSTLLDKNTPAIIMKLFNDYMAPKIVRDLDVSFTEEELREELKKIVEGNLQLAGEVYTVKDPTAYKSKTSLQYQIAEVYGEGKHLLIPNRKNVGVGKAKGTKKRVGVRYCTIEEFKKAELLTKHLDYKKLLDHVKPFFTKPKSHKV